MKGENKKIHSPGISLSCIDSLKYAVDRRGNWFYQFEMKHY